MKYRMCTMLFFLLILTTAFFFVEKGDVEKGKAIYAKKCASCHDKSGEGKAAIARLFEVTMKPLGSKEIQSQSDSDLKAVVVKGKGKMRMVSLKDDEIDNVISFIRTLAKQ